MSFMSNSSRMGPGLPNRGFDSGPGLPNRGFDSGPGLPNRGFDSGPGLPNRGFDSGPGLPNRGFDSGPGLPNRGFDSGPGLPSRGFDSGPGLPNRGFDSGPGLPSRGFDSGPGFGMQRSPPQSSFRPDNRGPAPSVSGREHDSDSSLLARFGLSSSDLDELSRVPEEKITAANLPEILQHIKRRRAENMDMANSRDRFPRDDVGPPRRPGFDDRQSGIQSSGDYGRGPSSREPHFREGRMNRFRPDPSFHRPEGVSDHRRGLPPIRNIDDFHGIPPKVYPYFCSLCELSVNSPQSYNEHVSGLLHHKKRLRLLESYPQWKPEAMDANRNMGSMPGPSPQRGNRPGMGGMQGPRGMQGPGRTQGPGGGQGPRPMQGPGGKQGPKPLQKKRNTSRVIHILDFEPKANIKKKLIKLVERLGKVTNTLILKPRREAFIEMAKASEAAAAVNYFGKSTAHLYGKPLRVMLSVKYKTLKKDEGQLKGITQQKAPREPKKPMDKGLKKPLKAEESLTPVEGIGRVLRIVRLPDSSYMDSEVKALAEAFGKITNFILIRKMHQAFVEMEREEDAKAMVDHSAQTPIIFHKKTIKVFISQKYKELVIRTPNPTDKKRKKPEGKDAKRLKQKLKQKKTEESDVTAEEDFVTASCDPEEGEQEAEMADKEGVSGEAEGPDDQNEVSENQSETVPAVEEPLEGIVTLNEFGNERNKKENGVESIKEENGVEQPVEEMEVEKSLSETNPDGEGEATEELGPYQPNVPVGVSYVTTKTGYYCKLCALFYTNEEMAKVKHCSSLAHYNKLKEITNQKSSVSSPEKVKSEA